MEFALNIFQLFAVFAGGLGFLFIGMGAVFCCLILFWEYAMTKRLARIGMEKTIIFKRLQKQGQKQAKEIKALREKDKHFKNVIAELTDCITENKNSIADILQNTLALKVPLVKIKEG